MADLAIVQRWLVRLGRLTAAASTEDDAGEFVELMAPLLAMRFPDETFTVRSLEHVAALSKFLPVYGEIVDRLHDWQRQQPRHFHRQLNDNVVDLKPESREWLAYWQQRQAEGFAPLREPDGRLSRPDVTDWREHTLSLLRHYAEDVWRYVQRDEHAA